MRELKHSILKDLREPPPKAQFQPSDHAQRTSTASITNAHDSSSSHLTFNDAGIRNGAHSVTALIVADEMEQDVVRNLPESKAEDVSPEEVLSLDDGSKLHAGQELVEVVGTKRDELAAGGSSKRSMMRAHYTQSMVFNRKSKPSDDDDDRGEPGFYALHPASPFYAGAAKSHCDYPSLPPAAAIRLGLPGRNVGRGAPLRPWP